MCVVIAAGAGTRLERAFQLLCASQGSAKRINPAGPDITYFLDAVFHSSQDSSLQSSNFAAPRVPGLMQTQEQ